MNLTLQKELDGSGLTERIYWQVNLSSWNINVMRVGSRIIYSRFLYTKPG